MLSSDKNQTIKKKNIILSMSSASITIPFYEKNMNNKLLYPKIYRNFSENIYKGLIFKIKTAKGP